MTSPRPSAPVSVRVPAKINLELVVGPRREDGYHDLATVFHAVGLFDVITAETADEWGVTVTGPYSKLLADDVAPQDNLAVKAGELLARTAKDTLGVEVEPVHLTIDKTIPVAAGMAGGSADAAGALVACDALWGLDTPTDTFHELAAQLGSDVNFALVGGTAIGTGRGEKVAPALADARFDWVVVTSATGLSTPAVFRELDRVRADRDVPAPVTSPELLAALRSGDAEALGAALANDMQEAAVALQPAIGDVLAAGYEAGAVAGLLSGSGPTCVFLARDAEHGRELLAALTAAGVGEQVIRTSGPVRGAHVITGELTAALGGQSAAGGSAQGGERPDLHVVDDGEGAVWRRREDVRETAGHECERRDPGHRDTPIAPRRGTPSDDGSAANTPPSHGPASDPTAHTAPDRPQGEHA